MRLLKRADVAIAVLTLAGCSTGEIACDVGDPECAEAEGEGEPACAAQSADFGYLTYLDLESNGVFLVGPPFFDEEHIDASWDVVASRFAVRFNQGSTFGQATGVVAVCDLTRQAAEEVTRIPQPGLGRESEYDQNSAFIVGTNEGGLFALANMRAGDQRLTFDFVAVAELP